MRFFRLLGVSIALAATAAGALAQLPPVTVVGKGVRNPVEKSYRKMVRGMDLFERRHALAPQATLAFRLLPRKRDTDMASVRVDVVGQEVDFNVPVAADGTFVLPRNQQALAEDAVVTPNRRAQTMTWRTEIRTPGLPPGTRRLGDLRLECEVGMEADLISNNRSLFDRLAGLFADTPAYCSGRNQRYLFFSQRPLFGVTLVSGARRQIVPVDRLYAGATIDPTLPAELPFCDCEVLLDRTYFLPLGDPGWPDDTLVQFEWMDAPAPVQPPAETQPLQRALEAVAIGSGTRADLEAALGPLTAVRFDSGYEVAVYRGAPLRKDGDAPELVVLYGPAGRALKARVRPADDNGPQ
ncbi:hypothetical protein ACFPOE_22205 [Caenimonas terrae]|uniref:DUF4424 domain-containing protein n=1 Tax=Caenimonas terrae TaxID=696074 RepID=A0ABW0NLQ3_9BURK